MKLRFLVVLFLALTSCASKVVFDPPSQDVAFPPPKIKKSATVFFYSEISSNVYWTGTRYFIKDTSDEDVQELVTTLKDSGYFSSITAKSLQSGVTKDVPGGNAVTPMFLKNNSVPTESDIQLNLREIGEVGHPYLLLAYMPWALIHVVTLGLVPIVFWGHAEYAGEITNRKSETIFSFHKICRGTAWSWSPFIFASETYTQPEAEQRLNKNCISSVLSDAINSGALGK